MSRKFTIYQLIPRLFGNTTHVNLPNGSIDINGCGKLNAITAKALREIKELGITHIWYTGLIEHATQTDYSAFGIRKDHTAVVKGKAGSPYAIKDYYDIDPDLAADVPNRMQEFEALVERTHKAGMKVLIDFVPNHVARQYASDAKPAGIADLGENDNINHAFNPQNNFYYLPNQFFCRTIQPIKRSKGPLPRVSGQGERQRCLFGTSDSKRLVRNGEAQLWSRLSGWPYEAFRADTRYLDENFRHSALLGG